MNKINVEFLEQYKMLDNLLKDVFGSKEGVSTYINEMECNNLVSKWNTFYKRLKHLRWLRNQLTHEYGTLNSELCTNDDIEWIVQFYNELLNTNDPLSIERRVKKEQRQKDYAYKQQHIENNYKTKQEQSTSNKKMTLWSKIVYQIKNWFSN